MRNDVCVGLRYREPFVPRDDSFADRRPESVVVAKVVVQHLVGHDASAWVAQQVSVFRQMRDDVRNFQRCRLLASLASKG